MTNPADILIRILGDSKSIVKETDTSKKAVRGLVDEVDKSKRSISAFGNVMQGVFQGIGQALFGAVVGGVRAAVGEIGKAIKAASDLNESLSKTQVAFGNSANDILEWSKTSATAFGQSRQQALEAASSFGLLFSSMGVTREESARMSKSLVELASDIASINNLDPEEALLKLRSGLVGETEPLRTVGVLLNATTVEAKALSLGLADSAKALTEQDKVMARYQLIMEQTALSQGDFASTSDQLANAQRILAAQTTNFSATMGTALLPIQLAFTRGLSELITIVEPYGVNIMRSLIGGIADGIVYLLPVLAELRGVFVRLLKPGSPPKLLPELTKWGAGAMQAYLEGWGQADFGALTSLGGVFEGALRSFASSGGIKETDLVSRVFGTQKALAQAVRDWRNLGMVTEGTFAAIDKAAGPAGGAVSRLAREYFDLQRATENVGKAQDELNAITGRYDAILGPLQDKLETNRNQQQGIRDQQRLVELDKIIGDRRADIADKQLARLEKEEIQLRQQQTAIEGERDSAVDAAQQKIDAAKQEEAAQQQKYDTAQAILDQQTKTNALIAEETALRQRLIDEGLAEQKRVLGELEDAQRKAAAEAERIADAQLRYNLASTDTAGQLEIMRGELAKTVTGSADYFDILTQIIGLEERLAKERDDSGGGGTKTEETIRGITEAAEEWPEVVKMKEAIKEFFATMKGEDNQVSELTWGQGILDFFTESGRLAKEAMPLIQGFIDLVMGKEVTTGEGGADPFGDNWWLRGIIPGLNSILSYLTLFREGDWSGIWNKIKQNVFDTVNAIDPDADPRSFSFYAWLQDSVIPAIEAFAAGDWETALNLLTNPINEMINTAFTNGFNWVTEFWRGITEGISSLPGDFQEWFRQQLRGEGMFIPSPINPNKTRPGTPGQDYIPPSDFSSAPGGIISPGVVAASATTTVHNYLELPLVFNVPVTNDIARSAAATVDEELRRRGWAPT